MKLKYNDKQRKEYFKTTLRMGSSWLSVFEEDEEFYSSAYWDLLTNIWVKDGPVRKTDALRFMTNIKSPHTAGKYVETAIAKGILIEEDNPADARSRLLRLSPEMRARLDGFFDGCVSEIRQCIQNMDTLGPWPKEP
jgi:hypothetical protein